MPNYPECKGEPAVRTVDGGYIWFCRKCGKESDKPYEFAWQALSAHFRHRPDTVMNPCSSTWRESVLKVLHNIA